MAVEATCPKLGSRQSRLASGRRPSLGGKSVVPTGQRARVRALQAAPMTREPREDRTRELVGH
jgi:hypothetical protein